MHFPANRRELHPGIRLSCHVFRTDPATSLAVGVLDVLSRSTSAKTLCYSRTLLFRSYLRVPANRRRHQNYLPRPPNPLVSTWTGKGDCKAVFNRGSGVNLVKLLTRSASHAGRKRMKLKRTNRQLRQASIRNQAGTSNTPVARHVEASQGHGIVLRSVAQYWHPKC